ncbi:MAG: class F sortase [Candidatus Dormibacteria bacterium]
MEVLFRRAALACWSSILALVVATAFAAGPGARVARGAQVAGRGTAIPSPRPAAIQAEADATPGPVAPSDPPGPGRLVIPRIGVDAPVRAVGLDKDGAMGVTNTSNDVGWYSPGVQPGDAGDAVMDGHLDWYDTSQAVFYNLHQLQKGDLVQVQRLDGANRQFRVTGVTKVAYNASVPGLFATSGPPRLSLITCGGSWDKKLGEYLERVIVDAELVE